MSRTRTVNVGLFRDAFAFFLNTSCFTNSRKGNIDEVSNLADKSRFGLRKKLIESDELDAIKTHLNETKQWTKNRCVRSFFQEGLFLVKKDLAPIFNNYLTERRDHLRNVLVPAFQATYALAVDNARLALGNQFVASDYPSVAEIPSKFGLEWNWVAFGVPEDLPEALRQAEAAKLTRQFQDAEEQILSALRDGFAGIISHVTDRLQPGQEGNPKIFRNTLFDELTEFMGTFRDRNLVNDGALEELVGQAQGILAKVKGDKPAEQAQAVRDSAEIRAQALEAFTQLKARIDTMERPTRRFNFDLLEQPEAPSVEPATDNVQQEVAA